MYRLTKYERTRILGVRADQIARGAPPTVDITGLIEPLKIAEKELREKTLPIIISRTKPNGKVVDIKIEDCIA